MSTIAKDSVPAAADIRLGVKGLTLRERQLLEGLVRLSERDTRHRALRIALVADQDIQQADVLLIDTVDPEAFTWARQQSWLANKAVIWLDAQRAVPDGHTLARRPVQWPVLPLLLSRALENRPHTAAPVAPVPAADKRPHVLLVDDSNIARMQLGNLVGLRGCESSDAASVEECLDLAARERFDIVFMDVMMPGTDGYEGCRKLKETASRAGVALPVVMLTSKSSPFDRIRGKMAGCDAYLTKPVDAQQLEQVLAQFAPGSHSLSPFVAKQAQHVVPPQVQSALRAVAPTPALPAIDGRPQLLLVDDSAIARTQLRNLVALRGCDTSDAASVEECMALVARARYDLVFMDILMPGTDGYEGCRRLKEAASRAGRTLPVVMLTSKTSPFDRIRGKMAGCDAYLTKPVDAQRLNEVLAEFAPGSHALPPLSSRQVQHSAPPSAAGIAGAA